MELTINQLIKIIIGVLVVALVVGGLVLVSNNFTGFFKSLPGNDSSKLFLNLLKWILMS